MAETEGAVANGHAHGPVVSTGSGSAREGWGRAILKSIGVLILAAVGFGVVPDRLITFLSTRVVPDARDVLVTLWVAVFFVFLTWLYVRLQPRRPQP